MPPPNLIVLPWHDADCEGLAALLADPRVARWHFLDGTGCGTQSDVRARWGRPARGALGLTAREGERGEIVAAARVDDGALEFAVRPACWRRGYGSVVAGAALHAAAAAFGTEAFSARVASANTASRRLLEKLGFASAGPPPRARRGNGGQPVLLYRLRVPPGFCAGRPPS